MSALWVDDSKPCPDGVAVARTYDDALGLLRRFDYDVLYLDHDLGDERGLTGYDLLLEVIAERRLPPRVECISWNPVGRARIEAAVAGHLRNRHATPPAPLPPSTSGDSSR